VIRLASRSENETAWLEARRHGFTASDANLMMTTSGRQRLLHEKASGDHVDLSRVPAVAWGKAREAAVMVWVEGRFGIPANNHLWAGENPHHLATPDGLLLDDGVPVEGCEVKCSSHEMDLGEYAAQIQWSMHIFGLPRWLLVWEKHDGNHPNPTPCGEPSWVWIERDQSIIDILVRDADILMGQVGEELVILDDSDEIAYYANQVLDARLIEARGKELKEDAWKKLQVVLEGQPDQTWQSQTAQVTWSTTPGCQTSRVDLGAMEDEDPEVVAAYRALQVKHTTIATGEPSRRLTITGKDKS
jgi:hypothetical protein